MKGETTVYPKPGESFDPALIPKAIHNAGFTATEVDVVTDGTLAAKNGTLELAVLGLKHPFILAGGARVEVLRKRDDLEGKRVRITGKLHPSQADLPPGLTVEGFQLVP